VVERIPRPGLVVAAEGTWSWPWRRRLQTNSSWRVWRASSSTRFRTCGRQGPGGNARIRIEFSADAAVQDALARHAEYVKAETLCTDLATVGSAPAGGAEWDLTVTPAQLPSGHCEWSRTWSNT